MRAVYRDILFIGNALEARDLRLLYDNAIAAVIDLASNEKPAVLGRDHIYIRIPILDGDGNDDRVMDLALATAVRLIRSNVKTLIACSAGMSRSPSVAAATIAIETGTSPDDCIARIVASGPNDVSPVLWHHIKAACRRLLIRDSEIQ